MLEGTPLMVAGRPFHIKELIEVAVNKLNTKCFKLVYKCLRWGGSQTLTSFRCFWDLARQVLQLHFG